MNNKEQEFEWDELKEIWTNSAQTKKINIQFSALLNELKSKISPFEKNSIKSDIATLKANWSQTKSKVSQFEKDSIKRDLKTITRMLKRFLNLFKSNKV